MAVSFDPQNGVMIDDYDVVRQSVRDIWISAFREQGKPDINVDPETPAGQIIDSIAAMIAAKDAEFLYLANMFDPTQADGKWQDALAKLYFLTRKMNEPTIVECTCVGRYGTVIPAGSIVRSVENRELVSRRGATIPIEGSVKIDFETRETGPIPIEAHTVNTVVTVIPGWDTVDNETAGIVGRNKETRAEFEARRKMSVAINSHGTANAIYGAVAAINGVVDCLVLENDMTSPIKKHGVKVDGHSVCIIVYGGDDKDIASAIYEKKDAGCGTCGNTEITHIAEEFFNAVYTYKILRPSPVRFRVSAKVEANADTTADVQSLVKNAILDDFNGLSLVTSNPRIGVAQTVYASRFYYPVIKTAGVKELLRIEIALDYTPFGDSVTLRGDQIPTLAIDDIEVEVVPIHSTDWV